MDCYVNVIFELVKSLMFHPLTMVGGAESDIKKAQDR